VSFAIKLIHLLKKIPISAVTNAVIVNQIRGLLIFLKKTCVNSAGKPFIQINIAPSATLNAITRPKRKNAYDVKQLYNQT